MTPHLTRLLSSGLRVPYSLLALILIAGCEGAVRGIPHIVFDADERFIVSEGGREVIARIPFRVAGEEPVSIVDWQGSCSCARIEFPRQSLHPGGDHEMVVVIDTTGRVNFSVLISVKTEGVHSGIAGDARVRLRGVVKRPPELVGDRVDVPYVSGHTADAEGQFVVVCTRSDQDPPLDPVRQTLRGQFVELSLGEQSSQTQFRGAPSSETAVVDTLTWSWKLHAVPTADEEDISIEWRGSAGETRVPFHLREVPPLHGIPKMLIAGELAPGSHWEHVVSLSPTTGLTDGEALPQISTIETSSPVTAMPAGSLGGALRLRVSVQAPAVAGPFEQRVKVHFANNAFPPIEFPVVGTVSEMKRSTSAP